MYLYENTFESKSISAGLSYQPNGSLSAGKILAYYRS